MQKVCFDGFTRHSSKCHTTAHDGPDDSMGLGKMFSDPNLLGKLATNPRTQKHLADPAFVKQVWFNTYLLIYTANNPLQIQAIQANPRLADSVLAGGDPRMIDVLGALMGIDMQGFSRPEGSEDLPEGYSKAETPSYPPPSASTSKPSAATPPPAEEDVEMDEADAEEAKAKKEAEDAKKAGSEAYKKRNFDEAAKLFEKAWELWPKDITFLTNLGGMSFLFDYGVWTGVTTLEDRLLNARVLRFTSFSSFSG
ncbi:hypothetical protein BDZ89DRAFT_270490 [Hymenopellis radicata]|nr:hypothetical protein BDZ89DRAFT_270490 [Hymenopellis radicata]